MGRNTVDASIAVRRPKVAAEIAAALRRQTVGTSVIRYSRKDYLDVVS